MRAKVRFEVQVPVKLFEGENGVIVAHCPVFDVSSQGCTEKEARKNIADALTGFLVTCYEMGTLDEVMKACGFEIAADESDDTGADDGDYIDIPLPFLIKDPNIQACHHA